MANKYRGEIEAEIDGRRYVLCLTLGALAELECAFAVGDLIELAERFQKGRMSAQDLIKIIGAGLRGGGANIEDVEVAQMKHKMGASGFAQIAAALVAAAFGVDEGPSVQNPSMPQDMATR